METCLLPSGRVTGNVSPLERHEEVCVTVWFENRTC